MPRMRRIAWIVLTDSLRTWKKIKSARRFSYQGNSVKAYARFAVSHCLKEEKNTAPLPVESRHSRNKTIIEKNVQRTNSVPCAESLSPQTERNTVPIHARGLP